MRVYHPEFETLRGQLTALGHEQSSLCRWLWSMARTAELGPVMFKMLAGYADKFEQLRR